jgi:hypothetical protein
VAQFLHAQSAGILAIDFLRTDTVLVLGEGHLRAVLAEYQVHYNTARPHQGIVQRVPDGEHENGHLTARRFAPEPENSWHQARR